MFLAIIAPSRSVHMVATQVSRRGGRRTCSPTPLPQRVYALNVRVPPSATKRLFIHGRGHGIIEESHASLRTLLYICMHVPTRNVPFFHVFASC